MGKFIAFEGPDGSGKTTIMNLVKENLDKKGISYISTREPGGTKISEKIRQLILDNDNKKMTAKTEALLYAASRAQLVEEFIIPNLENYDLVLTDRFVLSSLAYQGNARGLGIGKIDEINKFATSGLTPDATFFFMVDPETVLERKRKNFESDRLENEENSFHIKVYEGYIKAMKRAENIVLIDATKSIDEVYKQVIEELDKVLA